VTPRSVPTDVVAELAELRAQLEQAAGAANPPAAPGSAATPEEPADGHAQIAGLLQELQSLLSGAAEGAEDVIAEHPLPSVSAAFLLGLAVGWLAARG